MKTILPVLIIIITLLIACSGIKTKNGDRVPGMEEKITTAPVFPFKQLQPTIQHIEINSNADTLITGNSGTMVFVPKNSFINSHGEAVTGAINIELIEVLSIKDFIKANLQTVSNGRVLQSQGMFFINAKANDESLTLAPGRKLQVELPKMYGANAPQNIAIFTGNYDSLQHINWTETGKIDNKLIPLPLDLFDYSFWQSFDFIRVPKNEGYIAPQDGEITDSTTFKRQNFANTFVATREFEERFRDIMSAEWAIGHYTSYYSTTVPKGRMIKDSAITKIYLNNLDKDLWYCDSLAYAYMKTWEGRADFNSYWYSEGEKYDLLAAFKKFYEQHLTTVIQLPANINLAASNVRETLRAKGYSEPEIDEIVGAYDRQVKIVTARRNRQRADAIITNSFAIARLGWINCDQFYDDPKAKEVNIVASANNSIDFEFASFILILNNRRVALNGEPNEKSAYCFTGKAAPYTKLPIGEKATIVGLSFKNDKPYMSIKEIIITEKGNYKIDLAESSIKEVNDRLSRLY